MSKAANNSGTISKKRKTGKNGQIYEYWEARVTVGTDPFTGKQIQKSFTAKTQAEARQKMQAALNDVNTGNYFEPSKITVGEWLDLWTNDYCGNIKYLSLKKYKSMINTHIKPVIGSVKLCNLNKVMVQTYFNQLAKSETKGRDSKQHTLSPKTVRDVHGILSKALNTAVSVDFIASNPAQNTILPKVIKEEMHPLSDAQVKEFLSVSANDEFHKLFKLILFTGMRESEALGLTWDCVDFKKGTLNINKQLQRRAKADGGYIFAPLKNSKTRIIKPPATVMQLLRDREREQMEERFAAGEFWIGFANDAERKKALVFTRADGTNCIPVSLYKRFKKYAEDIGTPESRVHDLRHTYATLALQNGIDPKTVSETLGHATVAFTLDVYGHVSDKMKEDSAQKMEAYIQSIS